MLLAKQDFSMQCTLAWYLNITLTEVTADPNAIDAIENMITFPTEMASTI